MNGIYQYKTDAMQRILHLVSHGYIHYTTGEIPSKKVEALTLKFQDRYRTNATRQQRYRNKQKNQANTNLVLWQQDENTVRWWLLVTQGEGLIFDLEKLNNTANKKTRLQLTGYELLKTPRKDRAAQWTWRMTETTYKHWRLRLISAVRKNNKELMNQALHSLRRVPGFSEIRKQAFNLHRLAKSDWKRTQKGEWPYPEVYIGWRGQFQKTGNSYTQMIK